MLLKSLEDMDECELTNLRKAQISADSDPSLFLLHRHGEGLVSNSLEN